MRDVELTLPTPETCPFVRRSTNQDLTEVLQWLKRQSDEEVGVTFWVNRRVVEASHQAGKLLVYKCPESGEPVAFQLGRLLSPGILEVRHDLRGKGIGEALVRHCLALAQAAGEDILYIQCKPESSIPFWKRMGFTLTGDDEYGPSYGYRVLPRTLRLPEGGRPASVVIGWYPEAALEDREAPPQAQQELRGIAKRGRVWLPNRALFPALLAEGDVVVKVTVDGQAWYFNKAKYEDAALLGVRRNTNGFQLDWVAGPNQ